MRLVGFRDTCLISRDNGGRDEWDNPLNPETIYSGECLYEEGGTGYSRSIITRQPTVRINDAVRIVTEFGREIKSVVASVRDVNLPWRAGIKVTKIELKQAQGK